MFRRIAALCLCGMALDCARAQSAAGGLRGTVRDADLGGGVPGASVRVLERNLRAATDDDGVFSFLELPPGSYTLTVAKPGYERAVLSGVAVAPGRLTEIAVELKGEVTEMEEMVVREVEIRDTATEVGLLNIRAGNVAMQDAISGDLLRRAGAGDAAGALKLVVGASIEDGRYATVRGLSDRYVGAAVNGIRVPSADPKRRAVHMDLFPAGSIQSLSVAKTFTPNLPGDYSGGGVNIETTGIPESPFFKASFSREYDPLTTGRTDFLGYDRPPMDRWGRHRGSRELPPEADNMEAQGLLGGMDSAHDQIAGPAYPHDDEHLLRDRITRAFAPVIGTRRQRAGANWGAAVQFGDRGEIGSGVWGWLAALNYGRKYQMQRGFETGYLLPLVGSPAEAPTSVTRETGAEELKYSEMFAAGIGDGKEQQVSVMALRNRVTTDRAVLRRSEFDPAVDQSLGVDQAMHYTERSLDTVQLRGRHAPISPADAPFGLKLDWYAARNLTEQEEPDVRFFRNYVFNQGNGTWLHLPIPPGSSGAPQDRSTRIWRNTAEKNTQLGLNLELPFNLRAADPHGAFWGEAASRDAAEGRVRFGLSRDWTQRAYSQQGYYYDFAGQRDPLYTGPVYSVPPYRRGAAGRADYQRDLAAWRASPAGQLYDALMAAAAEDRTKASYVSASPYALWSDVFLESDRIGAGPWQNSMYWFIRPRLNDVSYTGEQEFHAGYAMVEFPVTRQLTLMMGARAENTRMKVSPRSDMDELEPIRAYLVPVVNTTVNPQTGRTISYYTIAGVPREQAEAEIRDSRWLPAASVTYALTPAMKLRGSWSRTIARPTFLEIAPIITYDFIEGEALIGNRDLRLAEVTNYDARWEWFRRPGEVYAFSWFAKEIGNPIEKESFGYLSRDYLLAVNYPEGRVHGVEVEFRRKLDFLPWPGEHLSLNVNYTRMSARVELPEAMKVSLAEHGIERDERDMEGQPKFLFNAGVLLDFERSGTSAGLFYNLRGESLKSGAAVGDRGARPDVYLLEQGTLNFSLSQKLGRHITLALRVNNLTEETAVEVFRVPGQPDIERRRFPDAVKTSFSVSASF